MPTGASKIWPLRRQGRNLKLKILTIAAATLALLASMLGAFCWWGLFTESGSRHFDEMAGLVPFYAGIAGALALLISLLLILWRTLLQRRR